MNTDSDLAALQSQIAALFPECVHCVLLRIGEGCAPVYSEELRAIASAVPSRRSEFACGRACAHRAIRELGRADGPILPGPQREPLWPAGIVGAISHASGLAGAAVAAAAAVAGLGLDIERVDADFDAAQRRLVFTAEELTSLDELHAGGLPAEVVVFGAKECVHKALFPRTGLRLDYQDVSVDIDIPAARFVATVHEPRASRLLSAGSIGGSFLVTAAYAITAVTLMSVPQ